MTGCSAANCANQSKDIRMFRFPRSEERRKMWESCCRKAGWRSNRNSRLCEAHFEADQYEQHRADGRKLLKPFAVPTIFAHEQKTRKPNNSNPSTSKRKTIRANADHTYPSLRTREKEMRLFTEASLGEKRAQTEKINSPAVQRNRTTSETGDEGDDNRNCRTEEFWDLSPSGLLVYRENSFREILADVRNESNKNDGDGLTVILQPKRKKSHSEVDRLKSKIKNLEIKLRIYKKMRKKKPKKNAPSDRNEKGKKIDLNELYRLADDEDPTAKFLVDQARILLGKSSWSHFSIFNCVRWMTTSPKGYNFARKNRLLKLPSKYRLKNYVGLSDDGQMALTSTMKRNLKDKHVSYKDDDDEKLSSLVVEHVPWICPTTETSRFFFGETMARGSWKMESTEEDYISMVQTRDKFLEVHLEGLRSPFSIGVGYFFKRDWGDERNIHFLLKLIKEIETCDFSIIRLVASDTKCIPLCVAEFPPKITHPADPNRFLYLSYDPFQIIRHVYREFTSKNFITADNQYICWRYLDTVQSVQNDPKQRAAFLDGCEKIRLPNVDTLSVRQSGQLFSFHQSYVLDLLHLNQHCQFVNAKPTAKFIRMMSCWLQIHRDVEKDVRKTSFNATESRDWLDANFNQYLTQLERSCKDRNVEFLSEPVYSMLKWTTQSTILFLTDLIGSHA